MPVNFNNTPASYEVTGTKDVAANVPYTKGLLKEVFVRYDADGDGRLSRQELKNAFKTLGSWIPCWRASRALSHVDKNSDGFVDEEEFDALISYAASKGFTIK